MLLFQNPNTKYFEKLYEILKKCISEIMIMRSARKASIPLENKVYTLQIKVR
jgi:hypothetical protein